MNLNSQTNHLKELVKEQRLRLLEHTHPHPLLIRACQKVTITTQLKIIWFVQLGQKQQKRKGKSKVNETHSAIVDLTVMEDAAKLKASALEKLGCRVQESNKLKEKELQIKEMHTKTKERDVELRYLFKDTSSMIEEQLQDYKVLSKIIRRKYGPV